MCSTSMRNDDLRAEILTQYFEMLSPSMKLQKPFFSVDHANEISFQWISFSIEHKAPKSNNEFSQIRRIRAICHLVTTSVETCDDLSPIIEARRISFHFSNSLSNYFRYRNFLLKWKILTEKFDEKEAKKCVGVHDHDSSGFPHVLMNFIHFAHSSYLALLCS